MYYQAVELRPGNKIEHEGDVWVVEEAIHRTPGNWRAYIQAKLRSLTNNRSVQVRFQSGEKLRQAPLENRKMVFLYKDPTGYVFMENETYAQVTLQPEDLGESAQYLLDNMEITVQFLNDRPIGVEVPTFVEMPVMRTDPGAKGDTVTNVLKPAYFQTGLVVQVPLFVNEGDVIKIDTRTGEYVTRVSKA